ncbi:MAG: NAD(P)H-dependent oxidoreductase [Planctomycetota bacterium]|jgi:putative NADPH-quinone reductase|nr:NAD(P)H-dependent oxidoreductase [Planctomycetota bacterium]MDP6762820.1 NAD(P)H-dependent oxidoreductase [Planctomycetota bacterium]MDP6990494.1 NAD(P)H-dependent oxidoreductase [Planctomycetota bacterium]
MKDGAGRARVLVVHGAGRERGLSARLVEEVVGELERRGAEHRLHDLLADGFDPVLRLQPDQRHAPPCTPEQDPLVHRYQLEVRWAEILVLVHPVWWFAPPAIMKGWVDRVLVEDVALAHRVGGSPLPLLAGRRALLVQTFNTRRSIDRWMFRGVSEAFWRRAALGSCGVRLVGRVALYGVEGLSGERLEAECARLRAAVAGLVV